MKSIALAAAFLLEMVAFFFFAAFAFTLSLNTTVQAIISVVMFVLLVVFWSLFMAPKAPKKFGPTLYFASKAVIYAIAGYSILELTSLPYLAAFVTLEVIDEAALLKHNLS